MFEIPRLEMPILESPFRHLFDGPFGSAFVVRRAGQTRTVNVSQHVHRLENLRMLHAFFANAREFLPRVGILRDELSRGSTAEQQ